MCRDVAVGIHCIVGRSAVEVVMSHVQCSKTAPFQNKNRYVFCGLMWGYMWGYGVSFNIEYWLGSSGRV